MLSKFSRRCGAVSLDAASFWPPWAEAKTGRRGVLPNGWATASPMANQGYAVLRVLGHLAFPVWIHSKWIRLSAIIAIAGVLVRGIVVFADFEVEAATIRACQAREAELRAIAFQKEIDLHIEHLRIVVRTAIRSGDPGRRP